MASRKTPQAPAPEQSVDPKDHTKDELVQKADDAGVEVKTADTKADIAEKLSDAGPEHPVGVIVGGSHTGPPIKVDDPPQKAKAASAGPNVTALHMDQTNIRGDQDGVIGGFVRVVEGAHKGKVAVFTSVEEHDKDGYPVRVLVRFRDATYDHEYATVDYANVRPVPNYVGG